MKNIILVKHSLPEIVSTAPAKEWRLSQSGQIRCAALAEKLEPISPDVIISSVEPKAIETGQIITKKLNKPFSMVNGLQEHDRTNIGLLEKTEFENKVKEFFDKPESLVFGRETACQSLARFSKAISSIESEYPDKNIVIVAHGTVITLFVSKFNAVEAFSFWRKLDLPSFVVLSLPSHKIVKVVEGVV
ncbi:MAG: histidine phosphatase family protein [Anaerolineales bacterium]